LPLLSGVTGGHAGLVEVNDPKTDPPTRRRVGRWLLIIVGTVTALILGFTGLFVLGHVTGGEIPRFPSLAAKPDPSLQGTVAYLDGPTNCVRILAAAGSPSKELLCLPPLDPKEAKALGKPLGPQLVWLGDGRLEVTMFRMTDPPGPNYRPGWQKIVDVRTGAVTDTPAAEVPSTPNLTTRPVVSPSGERIRFTSDSQSGHVRVTLTDASGRTRTLLEANGPGEYTYGLASAFWSPTFDYVLADDGRILVITTGKAPLIRVLVESNASSLGGGASHAGFAVSAENLLAPTG
jgi:hypothetical protein